MQMELELFNDKVLLSYEKPLVDFYHQRIK